MKTRLVVASILLLVQAGGCGLIFETPPFPQNAPTPTPPIELQTLPRNARIRVGYVHPEWGPGEVYVWELPGLTPSDLDSAYMGERGNPLGAVLRGTEVTIVDYAWSETDQEFWAYVRTSDALEGWIPLNELDLSLSP